jgi:DNA-binding beta-propeller fold protein YncE
MSTQSSSREVVVGAGKFRYRAVVDWEKLPDGWNFVEAVGVAVDSRDRVFVFCRGEHPVICFDSDGSFLFAWGEGQFNRPHGIAIGPDDSLYLSDDRDHTVRKFTAEGELLLTLGTSGRSSETGVRDFDYRTITAGGGPFNHPTNLALGAGGEMYVADGYGNCRVHKFSPEGQWLHSWGEPGAGPGQFNLPHGIGVDRTGRVAVADRENDRVQFFSPDGEFLDQWTDLARPTEVFFDAVGNAFVSELGRRAGMFPWMTPDVNSPGGRMSIFDADGNLLARWGGGENPTEPGDFYAPHDVWVDSRGDLYVGEVTWSAGGDRGLVDANCPSLQKFVRV